ncbi:LCP family protein required for cell wall assembly [Symbiobacterium terraclitae]|uniref:LCP family protein required for cell wall assembly n=1 Tax=Symbiobacterium terraclitae TaxID=557451 RepID=A0ABS4JM88_9FIRM|nr:LCP family protein required for cell wall assembly [Symbiobacterium terraclitae]
MYRVPNKHRRRKNWRWLVPLVAILAIFAAVRAISLYRPFQAPASANPTAPGQEEPEPPGSEGLETLPGDRQTFLVMGVEGWEGEWGRSDSMMVVSYDPAAQRVAMLSIPRDLWTKIPGHGYDKINHAFAYGGPTLSVETVERLLGIDINHWVAVSFEGFVEVIDALGGVEVNPPEPLYYHDPYDTRFGPDGLVIDIAAGPQVMDGLTALKYARFRADAEGDIGRMRRQQEIIKAAVKKAATPAIIGRAPQLISALYSTIGTDMSVGEMISLASKGRPALSNPIVTGTLTADEYWIDGVFYFGADLVDLRTAAYELLVGEQPPEAFVAKAKADNEEYQAVLQEAYARSQAAAAEMGESGEEEPGDESGEDGDGATGEGGAGDDGDGGEPGEGSEGGGDDGEHPDEDTALAPIKATVNLVDATGRGIAWEYVDRLEAVGLQVARVHESSAVISSTMAVVRVAGVDVADELNSVLPRVVYAVIPDPTSAQDVDLILGTDLLPEE